MRLLFLSIGLALVAGPALADDRLEPAFSGTIVSTYPDGRTANLWLNKDGTYKAEGRRRKLSSGIWSVKGDQVCMKQKRPFTGPFTYCQAVPEGVSWSGKAPTGEPIRIRLLPRRSS